MDGELRGLGLAHYVIDGDKIKLYYSMQIASDTSVLRNIIKVIVAAARKLDPEFRDDKISSKFQVQIADSEERYLEITVPFPTKKNSKIELIHQDVEISDTENWDKKNVKIGTKEITLKLDPIYKALNEDKRKRIKYIFRIE